MDVLDYSLDYSDSNKRNSDDKINKFHFPNTEDSRMNAQNADLEECTGFLTSALHSWYLYQCFKCKCTTRMFACSGPRVKGS